MVVDLTLNMGTSQLLYDILLRVVDLGVVVVVVVVVVVLVVVVRFVGLGVTGPGILGLDFSTTEGVVLLFVLLST